MREQNVKVCVASGDADIVIALQALAAVAADAELGPRFLALTGLAPMELRARAGDPTLLAALTDFLAADEPSLRRIATAIETPPARLATLDLR